MDDVVTAEDMNPIKGIVDQIARWTEIPLSETLEEERIGVQKTYAEILSYNVGNEERTKLIAKLQAIEHATSAIVCDSGMQATALAFDVLMEPGGHAVLMRQVYNKTRSYLEWMAARLGGAVTVADDGDTAGLAAAIRPETRFVFAETFTNPLVRAQDLDALFGVIAAARHRAPSGLVKVSANTKRVCDPMAAARPAMSPSSTTVTEPPSLAAIHSR